MELLGYLLVLLHMHYAVYEAYRIYLTRENPEANSGTVLHCMYGIDAYQRSNYKLPLLTTSNLATFRYCQSALIKYGNEEVSNNLLSSDGQGFDFDYLRMMGVTPEDLFHWYAPMDTIEAYILGESDGEFFNCSDYNLKHWFGPKCQYGIDIAVSLYILNRRQHMLHSLSSISRYGSTNGTCYESYNNDCESVVCLDWREICDGKIDCANGFDELRCEELEMNTCDDFTEFRCRNGWCIDKVFYLDGQHDCLDLSDEPATRLSRLGCEGDADFACEDRTCPPTWFSCGNGKCYDGPHENSWETCNTQRDEVYLDRMPRSTITLFSWVDLIYTKIKPLWICYDHALCPQLSLREFNRSMTPKNGTKICRAFTALVNQTYATFNDMLTHFKDFVRSCASPSLHKSRRECQMFSCNDRSKCLSFYRLTDGYNDCPSGEDEHQNNTCLFGFTERFACDHGARCIPRTLINDQIGHCADQSDEFQPVSDYLNSVNPRFAPAQHDEPSSSRMQFWDICDGIQDYYPDAANNTDETDCTADTWPCRRADTTCNGIWNCADGSDELNCTLSWKYLYECNRQHAHFCLNITTGQPLCLPIHRANDKHVDCVGATDERTFCRTKYPNDKMNRYRCQNSDLCISPTQVCDCHQDCPQNDDETIACLWNNNGWKPFCEPGKFRCRDGSIIACAQNLCRCAKMKSFCSDNEDKLFCDLIDQRRTKRPLQSWDDDDSGSEELDDRLSIPSRGPGYLAWGCNSGIAIFAKGLDLAYYCFCPHWYYGEKCQYQRKRVSFIIQPLIIDSFGRLSIFKFVVLLVRQNTTILFHEQFLYIPQVQCLAKYLIHLLYPIGEKFSSSTDYSIHVHVFIATTMEYRGSWQWTIPFNFLPVVRLAKQVPFSETIGAVKQPFNWIYNGNCTTCSNVSICMGHSVEIARDVCICPLHRIGSRCLIPFNVCTKDSCHGHGQCISIDERLKIDRRFRCICNPGWHGEYCTIATTTIDIHLSNDITIPSLQTLLIHVITQNDEENRLTYFDRINEGTRNVTIMIDKFLYSTDLVFIQLLESVNQSELYLAPRSSTIGDELQSTIPNTTIIIDRSHRCIPINRLFNSTIVGQPQIRRVKHFHRLCRPGTTTSNLYCFYDEKLMCRCKRNSQAFCFNFDTKSISCLWNKCSNRGKCIQNHAKCPTSSSCICEPCSYGSICQFTTSGYSMSLDAILSSHVHNITPNIYRQTAVIKIAVLIVGILAMIGILLNVFAIGTFSQTATRRVGCGSYLLISSWLGLFTWITLMCKIMLLIGFEQNNISCSLIEFLLKWWPLCSEWLHAFVAIERAWAVKKQVQYSNQASVKRAKLMIVILVVSIGLICSPELIYRRIVIDHQDQHIWCAFTLNPDKKVLQKLYAISDLLLFLVPLSINLITSIVIIMGTLRSDKKSFKYTLRKIHQIRTMVTGAPKNKGRLERLRKRLAPIKTQIVKHKHILIAPAMVGVFSASRLVMSLIFVCTKLDRHPILTLLAYLIGFFPSMGVLFAFIIPSEKYREACGTFINAIVPKFIRMLFVRR